MIPGWLILSLAAIGALAILVGIAFLLVVVAEVREEARAARQFAKALRVRLQAAEDANAETWRWWDGERWREAPKHPTHLDG